jgi:hypothetical protein
VTKAFLDGGATVIATSRKIQSEFSSTNFTAMPADISTLAGATALADQVLARFGKLNVLAHTVGGFAGGTTITDTDDDTFQRTVRISDTIAAFETLLLFGGSRTSDEDIHESPGALLPVRTRRHVGDADKGPKQIERVEISPDVAVLNRALHQRINRSLNLSA